VSDQKIAAAANVPAQKIVTELKTSANLMTLDSGLFCIFNAPGGPMPDAATGLPGVRVSVPPGPVFRPEAVTITGFRDDGWLGGWNGAALVRVTRGPAQILVTIYQAPNTTAEPPRLQILRLAEAASLPPLGGRPQQAPPPAQIAAGQIAAVQPVALAVPPAAQGSLPAPQTTPPALVPVAPAAARDGEITAHVQGRGDVTTALGDWMGEPGSKRWVEGFAISPTGLVGPGDIEYQAVLGRGWLSPWAEGGQYCGSRGMSLPILGLRMRLRGEAADRFDCFVEASFVDGTKVGPTDDGEPAQAESLAPLEAFRIKLVAREEEEAKPAPSVKASAPKPAYSTKAAPPATKAAPAAPKAAAAKPKVPPAQSPAARKPAYTPVKPPTRKK